MYLQPDYGSKMLHFYHNDNYSSAAHWKSREQPNRGKNPIAKTGVIEAIVLTLLSIITS
jgi:hypothetical protein